MQLVYTHYMNYTGYSIAAQDYILSMLKSNVPFDIKVKWLNADPQTGISANRRQIFTALKNKKDALPQTNLYHSIPNLYKNIPHASKNIGFAIFETINPPKKWAEIMNNMNRIITASSFNKGVFESIGVNAPVSVVPHCFDPDLFNADVKPVGRYGMTTFYSMGTWKNRKNWETLIKAFYDAFEDKNKVCLVIKTDNPKNLQALVARVKRFSEWRTKNTAPIYADKAEHCEFEEIPKLMKKGDIYVSASLGEGFAIPVMHAMALGMPVIVPRFGGLLEYALPQFVTYIEPAGYKEFPVMDGVPQFDNCIWPVITVDAVRDAMKKVFNDYPSEKSRMAYEYVHINLTYNIIGPKFKEAVSND